MQRSEKRTINTQPNKTQLANKKEKTNLKATQKVKKHQATTTTQKEKKGKPLNVVSTPKISVVFSILANL